MHRCDRRKEMMIRSRAGLAAGGMYHGLALRQPIGDIPPGSEADSDVPNRPCRGLCRPKMAEARPFAMDCYLFLSEKITGSVYVTMAVSPTATLSLPSTLGLGDRTV